MKKSNYSYVGVSFIILVFGIYFVPKIIDRINNKDVTRNESRSDFARENQNESSDLAFIEINGKPRSVPDFSFTNQYGKTITNKDYKGKVYVIEFFFTTCPTICPLMNANLVQIQNEFSEYKNFGVASFTINPEHDTVEILKTYADKYGVTNPNWNLMTGDQEAIYKLANEGFNLYAAQDESVPGGFEHSGNFALIDKNGFLRSRVVDGNPIIFYNGMISPNQKVDQEGMPEEITLLKEDIVKLLNE